MSHGYFSIPRSLSRDINFQNLSPHHRLVFIAILDHALFTPMLFDVFGHQLQLNAGQLCTTHCLLAEWSGKGVTKSHVERGLKKLEEIGCIKCEDFSLFSFGVESVSKLRQNMRQRKTVITIKNIDAYNLIVRDYAATNVSNPRQTRGKLAAQSNNDNPVNNENIYSPKISTSYSKTVPLIDEEDCPIKYGDYVTLKPSQYQILAKEKGADRLNSMINQMNDYIKSDRGKAYLDYFIKLNQWFERKESESGQSSAKNSFEDDKKFSESLPGMFPDLIGKNYMTVGYNYIEFSVGYKTNRIEFGVVAFREQVENELRKLDKRMVN